MHYYFLLKMYSKSVFLPQHTHHHFGSTDTDNDCLTKNGLIHPHPDPYHRHSIHNLRRNCNRHRYHMTPPSFSLTFYFNKSSISEIYLYVLTNLHFYRKKYLSKTDAKELHNIIHYEKYK